MGAASLHACGDDLEALFAAERRRKGEVTLDELVGRAREPRLASPPPGAALFTPSEVANGLGVSVPEARRLMRTEIPHTWAENKKLRVDAESLDAFKAARPDLVNRSLVYFIGADGTGCVKIGWTTRRIEERVAQIQHASPFDVYVLATMSGGLTEERALHERFAPLRMRGEWFRKEGALADLIMELARAAV
jgi:hypothetical protein